MENNYYNIKLINNYEEIEIEEIIKNEDIVLYFKNDINRTLENDSNEKNLKYLKKITLIVGGKKGVGKSTLINCLLKEYLAKEGEYSVTTLNTDTYTSNKIPFLSLIDTRGYELNEKYNPDEIKKEVLNNIELRRELKDYNNYIQCILFCIDGENDIDECEKKSLNELINNKYNVPLIIVFTNATEKNRVKIMEREFKNLFPNNAFIPVLGRKNDLMEQYGLDELLNIILKCLESVEKGLFFDLIKDEYLQKEKARLIEIIPEIKKNIISKLVNDFILNFKSKEKDIEKYIYHLIEVIIMAFSFKNEVGQNTKILIKNSKNNIKNIIDSHINFYRETTKKYIDQILSDYSFKYLDLQVEIEREKNASIKNKFKRNREEFKNLISTFLEDNFYYVAQKYLVYRFIKDLFEDLSEKMAEIIYKKITEYLNSYEIIKYYKMIYMKVIEDFENEIDKYKNINGKIYE